MGRQMRIIGPGATLSSDCFPVFLGGPIRGAGDWRSDIFERLGSISSTRKAIEVVDPSRRSEFELTAEMRAHWEEQAMASSAINGVLSFWIANQVEQIGDAGDFPRPYGQFSRLELGQWLARAECDPTLRVILGVSVNIPYFEYMCAKIAKFDLRYPIRTNVGALCADIESAYRNDSPLGVRRTP